MNNRFIMLSSAIAASLALSQVAAAQASLPANVQADRTAIQQDAANLKAARTQLQADERAASSVAVAADRTAVRLARMQVGTDFGKLHQDAEPILQPDRAALTTALVQLHADQVANSASAIQTDEATVKSAELQLSNDRTTLFGDLGVGFGHKRHHG